MTFLRCKIFNPLNLLLTQIPEAWTQARCLLAIRLGTFQSYHDKTSLPLDYDIVNDIDTHYDESFPIEWNTYNNMFVTFRCVFT